MIPATPYITDLYYFIVDEYDIFMSFWYQEKIKSRINSLVPGRRGNYFKCIIFKLIMQNTSFRAHCEIALMWMPQNFTDEKSTLVRVMAWCRQATSHYMSLCRPRSLSPYGVTRPQWVNTLWLSDAIWEHRSGPISAQVMAWCLMISHQPITWTNLDSSSVRYHAIHLRVLS